MGGVTIRSATPDDAEHIAQVHVRSWRAAYRALMPDAVLDRLDPAARAVRIREWFGRAPAGEATLVAVSSATLIAADAALLGFVHLGEYRDGPDPEGAGEVYAIYVDPPAWGTGAGRALMDAAVAHLTAGGPRPVRLWTLDGNERARLFYERYGFVADGEVGSHPVGDGLTVPTVRFTFQPA